MRNETKSQVKYEPSLLENCRTVIADICAGTELNCQSEFLATFLDTIPLPVFYKDVSGKYLGCNKAFEQFLGKPREEIIGKTVYDMGPKEVAEKYESMDRELFERRGKQIYGWKVKLADGSDRDVIFHKASFNDLSGKTGGLIGIIQDITETIQTINTLKESEKDVDVILNSFTESIILTDASGFVLDANDVAIHRLKTDTETLKGENLYNFLSHEAAKNYRKMAEFVIAKGKPVHFEDERGGYTGQMSIYPVFDKEKKVEKLAIFSMDITAIKRADSLQNTEELYQFTIDTSMDGYVRLNLDGNILEVNEAYCTISGYTREELLCMRISDLEAIQSYEQIAAHICKVIESGKDRFRTKHRTKNGRLLDIEVSITYLEKAGPGFFCFFRDITERKKAEKELRDSLQTYMDIIQTLPSGLFIYQYEPPDRLILLESNPEAERLTGVTAREFKGREFNEIWSTARAAGVTDAYLNVIKTGKAFETENLYYKDKCIEGVFRLHAFCMPQNRLGVAFENITELKQTELALKYGEKKFSYIDSSSIGIVVVNGKGNYVDVNPAACSMTGYTAEELLSMNLKDLITPDRKKLAYDYYSILSKNGAISVILKMLRKDGTVIHCHLDAVKLSEDRYLAYVFDVAEQQKVHEQILLNETLLQSLIDILQHDSDSVQDLLDYALEKAIKLTESKIGYIYYYDEERQQFILNSWSKGAMEKCSITEPQTIYELEHTGLWGEAVRRRTHIIVNDFQAHNPFKKGYPQGHVELYKFMTMPVFDKDKIVAVVGVANKDLDYSHTDLLQLGLLMDSVWKILEKTKIEGELKKREKFLSKIFEILPVGLRVADKFATINREVRFS